MSSNELKEGHRKGGKKGKGPPPASLQPVNLVSPVAPNGQQPSAMAPVPSPSVNSELSPTVLEEKRILVGGDPNLANKPKHPLGAAARLDAVVFGTSSAPSSAQTTPKGAAHLTAPPQSFSRKNSANRVVASPVPAPAVGPGSDLGSAPLELQNSRSGSSNYEPGEQERGTVFRRESMRTLKSERSRTAVQEALHGHKPVDASFELAGEIILEAKRNGVTSAAEFLQWTGKNLPYLKSYFQEHPEVLKEFFGKSGRKPPVAPMQPSMLQVETSSVLLSTTTGIVSTRSKPDKQNLAEKLQKKINQDGAVNLASSRIGQGNGNSGGSLSIASSAGNMADKFKTEAQLATERWLRRWYFVKMLYIPLVLFLYTFNFTMVPIRMSMGDAVFAKKLWIGELVLDALLILSIALRFFMPEEIEGRTETDIPTIRQRYLKGEFLLDAVGAIPLQIIVYPLTMSGIAPVQLEDFVRINRLLHYVRFDHAFDVFSEVYLTGIHPTLMRILKYVFILDFYSLLCAVPVCLVLQHDPENTVKWIGMQGQTPAENFAEIYLLVVGLAAGRNYNYPITDEAQGVMLLLAILSLGSTSVIIAGVNAMVQSLVERSSRLSNKVDEVLRELAYMRIEGPLTDEIILYYQNMFSLFNTFDYLESKIDFFDELPPELQSRIHDEVSIGTIKAIPLFADVVDDVDFVRALAECLELFVLMPGTEIVRRGDEGDDMFFISKGEASVMVGDHEVAVLSDGSFFGEQALLFGGQRTATIVAKTLCQVYALSREDFDSMIDVRPEALERILEVTLARRSENQQNVRFDGMRQKLARRGSAVSNISRLRSEQQSVIDDGASASAFLDQVRAHAPRFVPDDALSDVGGGPTSIRGRTPRHTPPLNALDPPSASSSVFPAPEATMAFPLEQSAAYPAPEVDGTPEEAAISPPVVYSS
jgi:CRP-like cAMP-binding protein